MLQDLFRRRGVWIAVFGHTAVGAVLVEYCVYENRATDELAGKDVIMKTEKSLPGSFFVRTLNGLHVAMQPCIHLAGLLLDAAFLFVFSNGVEPFEHKRGAGDFRSDITGPHKVRQPFPGSDRSLNGNIFRTLCRGDPLVDFVEIRRHPLAHHVKLRADAIENIELGIVAELVERGVENLISCSRLAAGKKSVCHEFIRGLNIGLEHVFGRPCFADPVRLAQSLLLFFKGQTCKPDRGDSGSGSAPSVFLVLFPFFGRHARFLSCGAQRTGGLNFRINLFLFGFLVFGVNTAEIRDACINGRGCLPRSL